MKSKNVENNKRKRAQESLSPQRIEPEEKAYQGVLDIVERLQLEDATNIAITGPYGSGKSSILISLEADFKTYKYLNISLATLQPLQDEENNLSEKNKYKTLQPLQDKENNQSEKNKYYKKDENDVSINNLNRLIEYSILQQLVYRENQGTLPYSRLKRIFHLSKKKVQRISWAILGALVASIVIFEPSYFRIEWLCELLGYKWLNITGDSFCLLYLIWFVFKGLTMIVPVFGNSKLNKINVKSCEIKIVDNTSIFNIHLDEILYFFERTSYNVVVFEDLDRFKSTEIFLKLRELNLLLNESNIINRKIFFIYAVRDDLFVDADRVKCFDYITTVIPVINRSNAKSLLKEELEKRGITEIEDCHLQELGFFLHDMRLLKNIANEYVQYREKISKGISCEKLLAMIIYKNYFPKDFADLHDCNGKVYRLINLKDEFVSASVAKLENAERRRHEMIEKYKKERHLKETELRRIYIDAYYDRIGNNIQQIKAGGSLRNINDIAINEKLFNQLIASQNVEYSYIVTNDNYYNGNYYYKGQIKESSVNIPFSEIETAVDSTLSYSERLEALKMCFKELEEVGKIEIQKDDIRSQSLSQIMSEVEYSSNEKFTELHVPRLIEFLIVKGYIDENYYDYISYFYSNFIDSHDWEFVLDLKVGKGHSYDYPVNNPEACLAEIPYYVYRKNAILNIGLTDYLAENQNIINNIERLSILLRTVIENKKFDFLIEYYLHGRKQDIVFTILFSQHKELWTDFEKHDADNYLLKLIWYKYAEEDLSCKDSQDWLSRHFTFTTDHLLDIEESQWCKLIKKNKYNFVELNSISSEILMTIVEQDAYVLNKRNVEILVSYLLDINCESTSYQLVCGTENTQLIERIEAELGTCLQSVFSAPEKNKETEDAIIGILYSTKATESEKITYLSNQQKKIDLGNIESAEATKLALKCDVVKPTWENVIYYMNNISEKIADDQLVQFIDRHASTLSSLAVPTESKDNELMLLRQLIKTNLLPYETYCKVLKRFTRWRFNQNVPILEERRVYLMIENGMVPFSNENTTILMQEYSVKTVSSYLLKNKNDFLKSTETIEYTTEIALALLESNLTIKEKALIIPHFNSSILNGNLADAIISVLIRIEISLDEEFLIDIFEFATNVDEKIKVFNYTLSKNYIDEARITSFLKTLPAPYKYVTEKGKKPELPNTIQTKCMVELLKSKNYISSFTISKRGIRVNTKLK